MSNPTNTFLRYAIISGIFSIPFIPLIVSSNMFFPFITGKNFTFRIIIEIIFFLWAILAMRDEQYRPKFSGMLAAFGIFIAIMGLADLLGENPLKSFWSNFERMEGWVTLVHLFAYFLVIGSTLQTKRIWDYLFQTSLGVSLIICFYGILQLAGKLVINQGGVRVDATFGNATYLAIYLVIHIFLSLIFIVRKETAYWQKIAYSVLILLQTYILYHTATRGAILGLIGGVLLSALLIALFGREESPRIRKVSFGVIIAVFLVIGGFFLIRNTEFVSNSPVLSRFANMSLNETKTQARAFVWPMAIQGFKERPILGWGQENFNYIFNKYYDPRMYRHEPWFDRTHNVVLDWLIAGGLLGVIGYLSLYGLALYAIWRKGDLLFSERALLTGLFAGYFFHNLFVFDNLTSYVLFVMLLAYLHFDTARPFSGVWSQKFGQIFNNQRITNSVFAPIAIILAIVSVYSLNAKPIAANTALIQAISGGPSITLQNRIDTFKKALDYGTFANQEIREQLIQFSFNVSNSQGSSPRDREETFLFAKSQYEEMIKEAPNDARHQLFYGVLMNLYGQYGAGIAALTKAHELSPNKQTIIMEIGNSYIASGRYEEALPYLKEAFELDTSYEDARMAYAVGAIYAKKEDLLKELLLPVYGTVAYPNEKLLRAYADNKQYNRVIEIWQGQVMNNPTDARVRSALAGAYYQAGRRGDALQELYKARDLEKDPTQRAQLEGAIKELLSGK